MIKLILLITLLVPSFSHAQAVETIKGYEAKENFLLFAFESLASSGKVCTWLRKAPPFAIDISPREMALTLQLTDAKEVTKIISGDIAKVRIKARVNKGRMKKFKLNYPFTEVNLDIEGYKSVYTPTRMMIHIVAVEEGYITDRFVECK